VNAHGAIGESISHAIFVTVIHPGYDKHLFFRKIAFTRISEDLPSCACLECSSESLCGCIEATDFRDRSTTLELINEFLPSQSDD